METLNTEKILQILKDSGVADFRCAICDVESNELFFVHGKLETARKAESRDTQITVYVDHDGKRGNSSFCVNAATTESELQAKIALAAKQAALIFDEPYVLPDNETLNAVVESNIANFAPFEVAKQVAEAVYGANPYPDCDVNALEVFVTKKTTRVINSRGIDKTQTKYGINVEAIPTCDGEDTSVELFEAYNFAELDAEGIKKEIAARIADVRARLHATVPKTPLDCPVVLNAYELKTLFCEIAQDVNYAAIYNRANLHSVGDALQSAPTGDRLNITMRGNMKGSPAGGFFDADGTNLADREIVSEGRFVAGYGASRFASYLGKTATGALQCVDVACGATPVKQMLSEPYLELVYLSGLQVDLLADYIGGEIRLAYYFDGEKKIPVTGIAMSGKLSQALNTIVLSEESVTLSNYRGPEKAKLKGLKIY